MYLHIYIYIYLHLFINAYILCVTYVYRMIFTRGETELIALLLCQINNHCQMRSEVMVLCLWFFFFFFDSVEIVTTTKTALPSQYTWS